VGGDGGAGGNTQGGGAGGGAVLIASSSTITINGTITANGGSTKDGTGGNGGAIRLVAPRIQGMGEISARAGRSDRQNGDGTNGRVRIEVGENEFRGNFNGTPYSPGKPFGLFLPPEPPPSILITSVAGTPVNATSFAVPSTKINVIGPVTITLEARNVPIGTVPKLQILSDAGAELIVEGSPFAGTLQQSSSSVQVTLPFGASHTFVLARW
jgi:hypothetical protein